MEYRPGLLYELPVGEPPSWFMEALDQIRREGVGKVSVALRLRDGGIVSGELLAAREGAEWNSQGVIDLLPPGDTDDPRSVPVEQIVGFQILPGPPIDHSDELRG